MASGFFLHASPRLEDLLDALATIIGDEPLPPLAQETIVVPTQGIARWLQQRLADERGIAASLRLPFVGGFLRRLCDGDDKAPDPLAKDELALRLWRLLGEPRAAREFGPAYDYCRDDADGRRRLQLCERLARVFDDYQVYRPDLLERWTKGDDAADFGPHAAWQGRLWRALLDDAGFGRAGGPPLPAAIRVREVERRLDDDPDAATKLGPRIHVFGAGSLPPAFLRLLLACARRTAVHLYVPQPADLREGESSNSWLDRFGQQAREFARALADLEEAGIASIHRFDTAAMNDRGGKRARPRAALATIQSRVADLSGVALPRAPLAADDDSLRVHIAHSPQRELEIVRDQILAAFAADATLKPHEVFVLVPDIEKYATLADAVFGPVEPHLPYRIADRSPLADQPLCAALFAVLELARGRVEASDVFRVLEQDAVRQRFGLAVGDLGGLRARCEQAGIRWGLDGARRAARLGIPAFEENSWRRGLDRLLLGVMTGACDTLALGLSPVADATSGRDEALGRFVVFCSTLFERLDLLTAPLPLGAWADRLDDLLTTLFLPTAPEDRRAAEQLRRATARLRAIAEAARLDEPVAPAALRDWLDAALAGTSGAGGFLSGAVTIASLTPMRTLPCRRLFVCGMSDQQFPRRGQTLPFDLIAQNRRIGDRDTRRDDRQLFLDLLTAARDAAHFTYVGRSAKDDSECAPSTALDDLLDLVDATFVADGAGRPRDRILVAHPLQPWSRRYRDGADARLFAFGVGLGGDLPAHRDDPQPWSGDDAIEPPTDLAAATIALADLTAFWREPTRFFCERALGMDLRGADDPEPTTEDFALNSLGDWQLRDELLRRDVADEDEAQRLKVAHAAGWVPPGARGDVVFVPTDDEAQDLRRKLAVHGPRSARQLDVAVGDSRFVGLLAEVATDAIVRCQAGDLRAKDRIAAVVEHVVAAVARHAGADLPEATVQYGRAEFLRLRPLAADEAKGFLAALVEGFRHGLRRPLPFFPTTSLAFVDAQTAKGDAGAMAAARKRWLSFEGRGDGDQPAARLCFRDRDALALPEFAAWAGRIAAILQACEVDA